MKVRERGIHQQPHTVALQKALQALTGLTRLKLDIYWDEGIYEDVKANVDPEGFSKAVVGMTELR